MKKLLKIAIAIIFGIASVGKAQTYGLYQNCQLQTAVGQAVSGASVYFLTQPANTSSLTPLASVYSSSTGGSVTQPVTTNGFGMCTAYLAPGVYTVCYVSSYTGKNCYADQSVISPSFASTVINTGTIGQIAYYASAGTTLSGETLVPAAHGGTGLDTSASTGVPVITSGTWSIDGTLPVSLGGTGTSTPSLVAGTNVTVTGTWPNQTISASGGSGTSVYVDGSLVNEPNFNGTTPTADSGYTAVKWKPSGSDVIAEVPNTYLPLTGGTMHNVLSSTQTQSLDMDVAVGSADGTDCTGICNPWFGLTFSQVPETFSDAGIMLNNITPVYTGNCGTYIYASGTLTFTCVSGKNPVVSADYTGTYVSFRGYTGTLSPLNWGKYDGFTHGTAYSATYIDDTHFSISESVITSSGTDNTGGVSFWPITSDLYIQDGFGTTGIVLSSLWGFRYEYYPTVKPTAEQQALFTVQGANKHSIFSVDEYDGKALTVNNTLDDGTGNAVIKGTVTSTGLPAASGGSTSTCWNTLGSTTSCSEGGISGLTTGYIPAATSATSLGNSHIDDGVTASGVITTSRPVVIQATAGNVGLSVKAPAVTGDTSNIANFYGTYDSGGVPTLVSSIDFRGNYDGGLGCRGYDCFNTGNDQIVSRSTSSVALRIIQYLYGGTQTGDLLQFVYKDQSTVLAKVLFKRRYYYCHNPIHNGNPFTTYEEQDFHLSCFATFETELIAIGKTTTYPECFGLSWTSGIPCSSCDLDKKCSEIVLDRMGSK